MIDVILSEAKNLSRRIEESHRTGVPAGKRSPGFSLDLSRLKSGIPFILSEAKKLFQRSEEALPYVIPAKAGIHFVICIVPMLRVGTQTGRFAPTLHVILAKARIHFEFFKVAAELLKPAFPRRAWER